MEQQSQPVTRKCVIVVDDDPAVRNSLKFALEIEGFAVRTYADPAGVLAEVDLSDCACLIIDQNMPGMDGLNLIGELRVRHVAAPAILITSHPTLALSRRAATAGIPIVEKPLFGNALLDEIKQKVP